MSISNSANRLDDLSFLEMNSEKVETELVIVGSADAIVAEFEMSEAAGEPSEFTNDDPAT